MENVTVCASYMCVERLSSLSSNMDLLLGASLLYCGSH